MEVQASVTERVPTKARLCIAQHSRIPLLRHNPDKLGFAALISAGPAASTVFACSRTLTRLCSG